MELRQLEYFTAVARHRHFGRAAEESYVTQSAISQAIGRLERELGVALFDRATGGGVSLTAAGDALLEHADRVLAAAGEARAEMDEHAGLRRGVARLAVVIADAPWIAEALVDFHRDHPGLQLALRHGSAAEVRALARQGDVDLAVCGAAADELAGPTVTELSDAPLVAILAAHHPLAGRGELDLGDLREESFILGERSSALRDAVSAACMEAGFSPLPRFEVGDPATVRTLVAAGLGVALVPATWLREPSANLAVARLANAPRHRVALIEGASPSPAGKLLAEHIAATIQSVGTATVEA